MARTNQRPAAGRPRLDFHLLGPVGLWADGRRVDLGPAESAKVRCLLAVLVRTPGTPVPVDALVDRVWGDQPVGAGVRYKYIGWLRAALAPYGVTVERVDAGYVLDVSPESVDLLRFRALVAAARRAIERGRPADAATDLAEALALWQGPALGGLSGTWVDMFRDQLRGERREAAVLGFQTEMSLGRGGQLLPALAAWEAEAPTDEVIIGLHMNALHRSGQTAAALDCYRRAVARIRAQLSVAPGPDLRRIYDSIRGAAQTAAAATPPPATTPKPDGAGVLPRQLPPALPRLSGRSDDLAALTALVEDSPVSATVAVISGSAGVGKTTLAIYWGHRVAEQFPDGQLYADLRGFDPASRPRDPGQVVREFLDALGVAPHAVPTGISAQAALYRSLLAERRMLLILDNAHDAAQVRPLLPGGAACFTVVTTRTAATSLVAVDGAYPVTIGLLSPAEGRQLLVDRLGAARTSAEPTAVDEVVRLCAGLPLALSIAAARAAVQPCLSITVLGRQLSDSAGRLDALQFDDPASSVRAVLSWSYRRLDPVTSRVFRLISLVPGPHVSMPAVASLTGTDTDVAARALDELTRAHLVTPTSPDRYGFHDLLRIYAQEACCAFERPAAQDEAFDRLLEHFRHTAHAAALMINTARQPLDLPAPAPSVRVEPVGDRGSAWAWFEAEHVNIDAATTEAAARGRDMYAWQLAWTLADFYHQRGLWHEWAASQQVALDAATRLADPAAQARCHQYLGYALARLHEHGKGQRHLRRAISLYATLGDRFGQGSTHMMLAIALERQQRYRDALGQARRALGLLTAPEELAARANALNGVGWYHAMIGQFEPAITHCHQALDTHLALGNDHGAAATWDSLGYAYRHLGRPDRAVSCYQEAVALHERLGDAHNLAMNLVGLGDAYREQRLQTAARRAWTRALTLLEQLGHAEAAEVRARLCAPG